MTGRVVLLLSIAAALAAQQPPSTPQSSSGQLPSGHPGTIEGTVVNSITGAPVKKVVAAIHADNLNYAASTDAGGRFQFVNVEPGTYTFSLLAAQGYRQSQNDKTFSRPITLAEDQHVTGLRLQMVPLGIIVGRVSDDEGEPLIGAVVMAFHYDYSSAMKTLRNVGSATTDDLGTYRLYDLAPGHYIVRAQFRGMRPAPPPNTQFNVPETGFTSVFYPGVSDASHASSIEVLPGAETAGTDFRLEGIPVYHVRGKTGIGDTTLQYALTTCDSKDEERLGVGTLHRYPDGKFDLWDVPAGTWCLTATHNDRNRNLYGIQQITVADHSIDDVVVSPRVIEDIHGTLQIDGTLTGNSRIRVRLAKGRGYGAPVAADGGDFEITGVAPGTYSVFVDGDPSHLYLKSIEYAHNDVPDGVVNIGMDRGALILRAGTDAGQLTGVVRTANGEPAGQTPVVAAPTGPLAGRLDLVKLVGTDANGQFQMKGLAPGDYKVFAWENSDRDLMEAREFREEFESDAVAVTIPPSAGASVNVIAIPAVRSEKVTAKFR